MKLFRPIAAATTFLLVATVSIAAEINPTPLPTSTPVPMQKPASVAPSETTDASTADKITRAPVRVGIGVLFAETGVAEFESRNYPYSELKTTERNSVSGINVMLKYEPPTNFGWNFQVGANLQGNVQVNLLEITGQDFEMSLSKSSVYALAGYKLWRFGAYLGLQFPIFSESGPIEYRVKTQPAVRAELGLDLAEHINLAIYSGSSTFILENKDESAFSPNKSIHVNSYGLSLRLMTP